MPVLYEPDAPEDSFELTPDCNQLLVSGRLQRPEGPVSGWIRLWVQPTVDSRPASALVSRRCPRRRPCRRVRGRPRQTWASASDTLNHKT